MALLVSLLVSPVAAAGAAESVAQASGAAERVRGPRVSEVPFGAGQAERVAAEARRAGSGDGRRFRDRLTGLRAARAGSGVATADAPGSESSVQESSVQESSVQESSVQESSVVGGAPVESAPESAESAAGAAAFAGAAGFPGPSFLPVQTSSTLAGVSPSRRERPALGFDALRGRTVLFGGCVIGGVCASSETWLWDGVGWSQPSLAVSPPARAGASLSWDAARGVLVLFGGRTAAGVVLGDTWLWNGSAWAQQFPASSPPARAEHAASYVSAASRVAVFGGLGSTGAALGDTWTWTGSTWQQGPGGSAGGVAPAARSLTALADTTGSQGAVLFGGRSASGGRLGDTWTFDGTSWTQRTPATGPGPLERHAATFSGQVASVLLTGGWDGEFTAASWAWDGSSWQRSHNGLEPVYPGVAGVAGMGLAQAPKDGLLLAGGRIGTGSYEGGRAAPDYLLGYVPTGRAPFSTVDSQALTDRVGLGADLASGNLLIEAQDLQITGVNGLDLLLKRSFSSLGRSSSDGSTSASQVSSALPSRWVYDLLDTAAFGTPGGNLVVRALEGQELLFTRTSGSGGISTPGTTWSGPAGSDLRATRTAGGLEVLSRRAQIRWSFDSADRLTSVRNRNGNTITLVRDAAGRVSSLTDTAGRVVAAAYGGNGYLASLTDPTGRQVTFETTFASDRQTLAVRTRASSTAAPLDVTTFDNKTSGEFLVYDNDGGATRAVVAEFARAGSVTRIENGSTGAGPIRTYDLSTFGTVRVTDTNGDATSYLAARDDVGSVLRRVGRVTDALGRTRESAFDASGNPTSSTDALGAVTTSTYDGNDNLTSTRAPDVAGRGVGSGRVATATYTTPGLLFEPSRVTDAQGNSTAFGYDSRGNRTSATDTTNGSSSPATGLTSTATYNPAAPAAPVCGGKPGQTCTLTDGRGKTTSYAYDSSGNLLSITPPNTGQLGVTSFTYDALGRTATRTDGKGQVTRYTYDPADRVVQQRLSGDTACSNGSIAAGNCLNSSYDSRGNVRAVTDRHGAVSYAYDALSRLISQTGPGTGSIGINQTWDGDGNLTSSYDDAGTTGYIYDTADQLIGLAQPGSTCPTPVSSGGALVISGNPTGCTRFGYDSNGVRTITTYPTQPAATTVTVTPDSSGRASSIRAVTGTGSNAVRHLDLAYTYDRMVAGTPIDSALVDSRTDLLATGSTGGSIGRTTRYTYDTLGQLLGATERSPDGSIVTAAWAYAYDLAGNRTSASLTGTPGASATSFGYNDTNQLISRDGSTTGWSYDANGNQTGSATGTPTGTGPQAPGLRTATYGNTDQTLNISTSGGALGTSSTPLTYTGAGNGRRLTAGSTAFRTGPQGVIASSAAGGSTTIRDNAGSLIALVTGGQTYYYLLDNLGSVLGLVNSSGSKVNSYSYDPYGINRAKTETITNPWQYTGGHLDTTTGLYKFGIRYYDPTQGRFTQQDPTGQDEHYSYAGNSPCTFVDPSGARRCALAGVAGGLLGGLIGGALGSAGGPVGVVNGIVFGAGIAGGATAGACRSRASNATGRGRDALRGARDGASGATDLLPLTRVR